MRTLQLTYVKLTWAIYMYSKYNVLGSRHFVKIKDGNNIIECIKTKQINVNAGFRVPLFSL